MSEATSTAPAAPVAATNNQPNAQQGSSTPAPSVTPARDQSGKFAKGGDKPANSPITPPDDDPEFDFGDRKMKKSAILSELGRARHASKILTEAQQRAAKAEQLEKSWNDRTAELKSGPMAILKHLREAGLSQDEIKQRMSDILYSEFIEPEQLSPEARRIRELEAKLSEREEQEKSQAEKKRLADEDAATQAQADALMQEIGAAMEAGKLPRAHAAVRRVAAELAKFEDKGIAIPLDVAIARVREQVGKETGEFAASSSVDDLRDLWGEDAWKGHVRKVLDWALAQSRGGAASAPRPQPKPLMQQSGERKRITPQEFDNLMRKVK